MLLLALIKSFTSDVLFSLKTPFFINANLITPGAKSACIAQTKRVPIKL